jgi:DNA mismatch endonuclease (patch repair protein)
VAAKIAVACDADFWHGRDWRRRRPRLASGSNSAYWVAKIEANIRRDRASTRALRRLGWKTIRVWETDIRLHADEIAAAIMKQVTSRRS